MPMQTDEKNVATTPAETRERLIDAAGEIFAEQGRAAARVRDICVKAGANIAAINYHFGDKESLYLACVRHARQYLLQNYPMDAARPGNGTAEDRLRAYVNVFLSRFLDTERPQWHGKLLSRELFEPTEALDETIREAIKPQADLLCSIVQELAGGKFTQNQARLCAQSITAQCLFYREARSILLRLEPGRAYGSEAVECLTDHITRFSLGAIRDVAREAPEIPETTEGTTECQP